MLLNLLLKKLIGMVAMNTCKHHPGIWWSWWDLSMSALPHLEIALISFLVPLHSFSDLNKKDVHTSSYLLRPSFRPRSIEGCLKNKHLSETKIWDTPTLPNSPVAFCVFICCICKTSIQALSWCSGLHIWVLSFDFRQGKLLVFYKISLNPLPSPYVSLYT